MNFIDIMIFKQKIIQMILELRIHIKSKLKIHVKYIKET